MEIIVNNTVAVLGPAADRRSEWRSSLVQIRNQAVSTPDQNMVDLMDVILALLDAGGDPDGLGDDLQGVHAQTWLNILAQLPKN